MPDPIFENSSLIINVNNIFIKPLYKNIAYCEMRYIELAKGHVIKRWKFSFVLGLGLSIYFAVHIFQVTPFVDPTTITSLRSQMLIYLSFYVFLFMGLYLLYISLSRKPVIKIFMLNNQAYLYPLSNNKSQLSSIIRFFKTCEVTLINKLPEIE